MSSPRRWVAAVVCFAAPLTAVLAPAHAGATEEPQALPLTVSDPGNTGTTLDGDVKPIPEKFVTATDVEEVDLAVQMLAPAKDKDAVKTLVVTYRMGDVLPADTKQLMDEYVAIYLHIPGDDDAYDYNMFRTTILSPKRVGFFDGPGFGEGTKCGTARTNVKTDVIRQFIPMHKCVGASWSDDAIVYSGLQLEPGSQDPSGYRLAWNDMFHTGPLSYDLP